MEYNLNKILSSCPNNKTIVDSIIKTWEKINAPRYEHILCSISGGADSDTMLDICCKCDRDKKIDYVWYDTGLEYQATKDHLKFLEEKYDIKIIRYKAVKPIPTCCREYGQPFISKRTSQFIEGLQRHNFNWEDEEYENLNAKYPHCSSYLKWWCNIASTGRNSSFNISSNKWLKEFLIENPPTFKISPKCCKYAKKEVAKQILVENSYDLDIRGIRKFEGGARNAAYHSCFSTNLRDKIDEFRPLFWYTNADKDEYDDFYKITHSKCYTEYSLKRTGCVGCPFNRKLGDELEIVENEEPNLYKAVNNIFKESYEYTREYREYAKNMKLSHKRRKIVSA